MFNQHLLTQSHGDYAGPYATLRIMDIHKFVNSKTYFRWDGDGEKSKPQSRRVMVVGAWGWGTAGAV